MMVLIEWLECDFYGPKGKTKAGKKVYKIHIHVIMWMLSIRLRTLSISLFLAFTGSKGYFKRAQLNCCNLTAVLTELDISYIVQQGHEQGYDGNPLLSLLL